MHHIKENADQVISEIRDHGGFIEEYKDITFVDLFPKAARKIDEQSATVEETADEEEIDVEIVEDDRVSGSQYVMGQDMSSGIKNSRRKVE